MFSAVQDTKYFVISKWVACIVRYIKMWWVPKEIEKKCCYSKTHVYIFEEDFSYITKK